MRVRSAWPELEHVVVGGAFEAAAEHLAGVHLVEAARIAARRIRTPLAGVQIGAIGRHRHHHIVGPVVEVLGDLDGGDDVREPREADVVEPADEVAVDLLAAI